MKLFSRIKHYALWGSVLLGFFSVISAFAQPADRYLNIKARVLDLIFPLDVAPKPYFSKMILRYGDSVTQIVIVIYPGGKSEIIHYTISGDLDRLISTMTSANPDVKEQEIAAKLKVTIRRSTINHEVLDPALDELKTIQISPMLASRIAVDGASEYEFWYDVWQECVHYTITGPFKDTPQDKLVQWMVKFRANYSHLAKHQSPAP
jgi:hypothetical protein